MVSLTSFGPRLATLDLPLKSIFRQRTKPDHLMIVLDDDPVCRAYAESHTELADAGVEFVFDSIGLKPHNKYYYAMQKYPDAVVITVDDDSIYRKDTVFSLLFCIRCFLRPFVRAVCTRWIIRRTEPYGRMRIGILNAISCENRTMIIARPV